MSYSLAPSNVTVSLNAGIPLYQPNFNAGDSTTNHVIASLSGTVNGVTDTTASDFKGFANYGDSNQWFPVDIVPNTSGASATFLVEGSHSYQNATNPASPSPIVVYMMGPDGTSESSQTSQANVAANVASKLIAEVSQYYSSVPAGGTFPLDVTAEGA